MAPIGGCPTPLNINQSNSVLNQVGQRLQESFKFSHDIFSIKTALGSEVALYDRMPEHYNFTRDDAKELYTGIFTRLKNLFGPSLSYYWFWTPESWNWYHRNTTNDDCVDGLDDINVSERSER